MAQALHTHPVRTKIAVVGRATLAVAKGQSRKVDVIHCSQNPNMMRVKTQKEIKREKLIENKARKSRQTSSDERETANNAPKKLKRSSRIFEAV
jgi:hypothetical protein